MQAAVAPAGRSHPVVAPSNPPLPSPPLKVAMNINAADKMPNLSEKPDGVHPKLEKYILRKVGRPQPLTHEGRGKAPMAHDSGTGSPWLHAACCRPGDQLGKGAPLASMLGVTCSPHPTLPAPPPPPPWQAFDDPEQPYLPDEVLFRQKEQFSDGVGYDWVDGLKEYAAKVRGRGVRRGRGQLDGPLLRLQPVGLGADASHSKA